MNTLRNITLYSVILAILMCVTFSTATKQTIIPNSPRFIINLPDNNLLCISIDGFELFTFNLITSSYIVVNGFLNLTETGKEIDAALYTNSTDVPMYSRGFTDLGILVKVVDSRLKGGKRVFKHRVNGSKMKAFLDGFGEMDLQKGSLLFGIDKGHSNIESEAAKHETVKIHMDKPVFKLIAISADKSTFNVYVDDSSGLRTVGVHGLIGQFYSPKVRLNTAKKELTRADGEKIPVREGSLWDTVTDDLYVGRECWYPEEGYSAIQGEPWQYVVEHLLATSFSRTLYKS